MDSPEENCSEFFSDGSRRMNFRDCKDKDIENKGRLNEARQEEGWQQMIKGRAWRNG